MSGSPPLVLVVEHSPTGGVGELGSWLTNSGLALDIRRPYAGDSLPGRLDHDGFVVMGGGMGAGDDVVAPWLHDARRLLRGAVATGVPTLGICLGAQLLAVACGGYVERSAGGPEFGLCSVAVHEVDDCLFEPLPATAPVVQWHRDVVSELPAGAALLASSPACRVQAFRVGSRAWGVQWHPEVTAERLSSWSAPEPGVDVGGLVSEVKAAEHDLTTVWSAWAERWAMVVHAEAA